MGMILSLATVSASSLDAIRTQPLYVWQVVAPDYPELLEETRSRIPNLFARMMGRKEAAHKGKLEPLVLAPNEGQQIDVDKAWHAVHFLLNDTARETMLPAGFLLSGGEWVGDVDLGYGPGRTLSPKETEEVASLLEGSPVDKLFERFDGRRMDREDVYPGMWDRPAALEDNLAYVAEHYSKLRDFVRRAAAEGFGLLIWLS